MNVYDPEFARQMTEVFERDLECSDRYTLEAWRGRSWRERLAETVVYPLQSQL